MPPPFRASSADKIAAVVQILDSSVPFERKLLGIAVALGMPITKPPVAHTTGSHDVLDGGRLNPDDSWHYPPDRPETDQ